MSKDEFKDELLKWIGKSEESAAREALLIEKAPIAPSTLQQVKSGRYWPAERLKLRLEDVMSQWPVGKPVPVRKAAAG